MKILFIGACANGYHVLGGEVAKSRILQKYFKSRCPTKIIDLYWEKKNPLQSLWNLTANRLVKRLKAVCLGLWADKIVICRSDASYIKLLKAVNCTRKIYLFCVGGRAAQLLFGQVEDAAFWISRVLSPVGLGMANYASTVVGYLTLLSCLGVNTYGIREGGKYRDSSEKLGKFVSELLLINCLAILVAVMILIALYFLPGQQKYRPLLLVYGLLIFITPFSIPWFIILVEEYRYVAVRTLVVQAVGLAAFFIFIKKPSDYIKYSLITVGTSAVTMFLNLRFSKRYIRIFQGADMKLQNILFRLYSDLPAAYRQRFTQIQILRCLV